MAENFSLLLKPASANCNLACRYCFYRPGSALPGNGRERMSQATLETVIQRFCATPMEEYHFAWQGGEPMLMGLDFYRQAVALQQRYAHGVPVKNALQTNGTLIDDHWGDFLREYGFLVGVSIDGPAEYHDTFRYFLDQKPSHQHVCDAIQLLQHHGVAVNTLTLVNQTNQDHPETLYSYLKEIGSYFQQYIECVEFDSQNKLQPYSVTPGKWGEFLCRIFDQWYPKDVGKVSIRLFDSILSRLLTGIPSVCAMNGNCCNYFVVEANGNVYPCDFQVCHELLLGNVHHNSFGELWNHPSYRKWGGRKKTESRSCMNCRWLPLCMGDCPCHRQQGYSVLCEDWKLFFSYTIARFESLIKSISFE